MEKCGMSPSQAHHVRTTHVVLRLRDAMQVWHRYHGSRAGFRHLNSAGSPLVGVL
jgi:hypothetical protein